MENHHAFLIIGDKNKVSAVNELIESDWNLEISQNPDYYFFDFETLSIEDSRKIKQVAETRPFGEKKIIVIATNFIGVEAQNALLKTLEEPSSDTYLFLIIPNESNLLPTVVSRLFKLDLKGKKNEKDELAKKFVKSGASDRLKILGEFLSHESETKKSDLILFLDSVERELVPKISKDLKIRDTLQEIIELKSYLKDRSPSVKMIGEYLSIKLPVVK